MWIFLIVILLLAALLESFSLRGGASCADGEFSLSKLRAEAGEEVQLTLTVRNLGRLPVSYLAARVAFPLAAALPDSAGMKRERSIVTVTEVFRLWGRQSRSRTLSFSISKRGVHTIAGRELARGDFLGLRLSTARLDCRKMLLVYPPPLESSALLEAVGSECGELSARRWLLRDPVLTLGVREYTGTEPMHEISWSQTARRGELTVREFDFTRSLNCCVLLCVNGLGEDEEDLLDRCCGAARTVCDALIAHGVEATLCTNSALTGYMAAPMRSATASLGRQTDVLDILARVSSAACSSPAGLALAALDETQEAAAFVVIAPHDGDGIDSALEILNARSGFGALAVYVDALEVA